MANRAHRLSLIPLIGMIGCNAGLESGTPYEVVVEGRVFEQIDMDDVYEDLVVDAPPPSPRLAGGGLVGITDESYEPTSLHDLSRQQLAEALRPVMHHENGEFYLSREPEYQAADAILFGADEGLTRDWVPRHDDGRPEATAPSEFREVFGGDSRVLSNTTAFPWSAIVRVEVTMNSGTVSQCTGSFVGPYTFLTAAHCLINQAPSGGFEIMNSMRFEPGRQGSFNPVPVQCSSSNFTAWGVPFGFYSGGPGNFDNAFDYAVIDVFPCISPAPSFFTSYTTTPPHSEFGLYGYADQCPGGAPALTSQCGHNGTGYRRDWRLESLNIDATDGQSGAPWYQVVQRPVAGIHGGFIGYWDFWQCGFDQCRRNYARRIDSGVDTFIRSISWDW